MGVWERRRSPKVSFRGCRYLGEMGSLEGNAVRPAARYSAIRPVATAMQLQASGLPPLPTDCRNKLKPRPRCRYLAALPQPWGSSQSYGARSSRRMKIAKQVGPLRQVDPMGVGIRDAVLVL